MIWAVVCYYTRSCRYLGLFHNTKTRWLWLHKPVVLYNILVYRITNSLLREGQTRLPVSLRLSARLTTARAAVTFRNNPCVHIRTLNYTHYSVTTNIGVTNVSTKLNVTRLTDCANRSVLNVFGNFLSKM